MEKAVVPIIHLSNLRQQYAMERDDDLVTHNFSQ
jgi:hypothetical protein